MIYPEDGITKGELADYYAAVADLLADRPREAADDPDPMPAGRAKKCFFQKHDTGSMGEHVLRIPVTEGAGTTEEDYLYVEEAVGALECVQMNTIEFHGWGSRIDPLEKPDRLVFDLDPDEGLGFDKVKTAAVRLREMLADLGLETFPLLSGGKGNSRDRAARPEGRLGGGEELCRAVQPGDRRGRARDLHRQYPQEPAQGADLPRLAAQPAGGDGGDAVFGARPRRRAGGGAGVVGGTGRDRRAGLYTIRDAAVLLERAGGKGLKGWGQARQTLPDA